MASWIDTYPPIPPTFKNGGRGVGTGQGCRVRLGEGVWVGCDVGWLLEGSEDVGIVIIGSGVGVKMWVGCAVGEETVIAVEGSD